MESTYHFRNLIVWQKAQELAINIIDLMERLPKTWANAVIVRQIVSSATSIGANIAEGHGRFSTGAHRNHLSIARGSMMETNSWIDILRRKEYITAIEEDRLCDLCREIAAILSSKMIKLDQEISKERTMKESNADYLINNDLFPYDQTDFNKT